MSCQDYRFQISALLDSSLTESESNRLQVHLDTCSSCRDHYEREAALNRLLQNPKLELELPDSLWLSIEQGIEGVSTPRQVSIIDRLAAWIRDLARVPGPAYGVAGLVLLIFVSLSLFQLPQEHDSALLAQLDRYTLETEESGNPFLTPETTRENPFFSASWGSRRGNPFAEFRRRP